MFKEHMEHLIKNLKKQRKKMGIVASVLAGLSIGTLALALVSSALSLPVLTGISAMVAGTALGFSVNALVQTLILNSKVKMATKDKMEYEKQEELYYSNFSDKKKELEKDAEVIKINDAQKLNESNEIINDANIYVQDEKTSAQIEINNKDYKTLQNQSTDKPRDDGREC